MEENARLAAFRADPAAQIRARRAVESGWRDWLADPAVAAIRADLARYGEGAALAACPAVASLLRDCAAARRFAEGLMAAFVPALRREPLGPVPLGHAGRVLRPLASGRASLSLLTMARGEAGLPHSVCLTDAARCDLVLAGEGTGWRMRWSGPDEALSREPHVFTPGCRIESDSVSLPVIGAVARDLVILRLTRAAAAPVPVRHIRVADGVTLGEAGASAAVGRRELMVETLGAMGRRDAAPVLAALAGRAGPDTLRWHALRHALALDSGVGIAALRRIAATPSDPLAREAAALWRSLAARHPELTGKAA